MFSALASIKPPYTIVFHVTVLCMHPYSENLLSEPVGLYLEHNITNYRKSEIPLVYYITPVHI
jgi:hypothetical protein